MLDKILSVSISFFILYQAYLLRRIVGTWMFPACIFSLFWFVYTFIPLLVLYSVPINSISIAYIAMCCLIVSLSSLIFDWKKAYSIKKSSRSNVYGASLVVHYSFYVFSFLSILGLIINNIVQGFTIGEMFFNIFQTSGRYIELRYAENLENNIYSSVGVVLTYPAAIFGGMIYSALSKEKNVLLSLRVVGVAMAPSVFVMLTQGAKGTLFLSISLFVAGMVVTRIQMGRSRLTDAGLYKIGAYAFFLLFPIVVASFLARGLYEEDDYIFLAQQLLRYFASYTSGHLAAFSDWFSFNTGEQSVLNYSNESLTLGFYTFMAIFRVLGDDRFVPHGVYDEYFTHGDFIQTNIYTMFRGLITDFGLIGSLVFVGVFGLIVHLTFYWQVVGRNAAFAVSIFVHYVGFVYTSFIISLLIWNSIYASFLIVCFVLILVDLRWKSRHA